MVNNKSQLAKPYRTPAQKANIRNLMILTVIVIAVCGLYLLINSYPEKPKLFRYILSRRIPTLIVMLIAAFSIDSASIIFQSIINNRIVTPCLLDMNTSLLQCGVNEYPALIAMFGSPVAVSSAVMAGSMGGDEQLATQLVVWTSLFSIITIFVQVCILMGTGLLPVA